VIAPGGDIVAGPLHKEIGMISCEIDLEQVANAKRTLDIVGHYARPDIFTLQVNNDKQALVDFRDGAKN